MNLKKALTLIAWGFVLTIVSFNIKLGDLSVNILPDFIGWIMLIMAFDYLGHYGDEHGILKWYSIGLAVLSLGVWLMNFTTIKEYGDVDAALNVFNRIITLISGIYFFFLFGILEKICVDYGIPLENKIRNLKIANVVIFAILAILGLIVEYISLEAATFILIITGIVNLVVVVITTMTLFKLKNAIKE